MSLLLHEHFDHVEVEDKTLDFSSAVERRLADPEYPISATFVSIPAKSYQFSEPTGFDGGEYRLV
jgi:hypothetical protein